MFLALNIPEIGCFQAVGKNDIKERQSRIQDGHFTICCIQQDRCQIGCQQVIEKTGSYRASSIPYSLTGQLFNSTQRIIDFGTKVVDSVGSSQSAVLQSAIG